VGTDSGKVAKAGGDAFLKSDDFKALKKLVLDPELSKLKTSFSKDWDKDKGSIIVGGIFILLPTAALLASAAVANPKLDVPVVGDFYPRQGVLALASLGTEALTEGITKERFKLGFGYEKKNGLDVYSFELTFKGPKAPDADKTKADADKKTPGAAQKTPQQKELDKTRAEIGAPGSITLSGKVGPGQGEGTFKVDKPTDLGRLSVAPTFKVGPQGPAFATSVSLTSLILGNRIQFTGSAFANAPRPTGASVFDAKYDDPSKSLTVTTTPPLSGNGFWVGVQGRF
jgi:hypothetical protein